MKKTLYISAFIGLMITGAGCKKFLTEPPLTQVPVENYFKSLKDVNAAMAGIYASFQDEMTSDGGNFSGNYHYWGEGRSDNFDRSQYANTTITELSLNELTSGNSSSNWSGFYRTIGRANTAIKYIPQAQQYDNNVTPTIRDNNLAQCHAMRALCYFYIVRIWGDAVVWTEPYTDITEEAERPREPKGKVIDEVIIPDLQKAYDLIQKNQTPVVWNIGEAAIAAMLADVYMWKHDYASAKTWFAKVFAAKGPKGAVHAGTSAANLEPGATWKNLFTNPTGTNEAIWSIHWDYNFNGCACLPISAGLSNNPVRVDSVIHNDWKQNLADIRVANTLDTSNGLGHWDKVIKYYSISGNAFPTGSGAPAANTYNVYLTMYRLGDVYLSYAEALNKTGDIPNALKYLNFIRTRAGLTPILETDPEAAGMDALEDAILQERRYELFAEGKRWFDLVRTDHVKEIMDPIIQFRQRRYGSPEAGFGDDMNKILWPLHRQVLEDNKKLVQNLSYN